MGKSLEILNTPSLRFVSPIKIRPMAAWVATGRKWGIQGKASEVTQQALAGVRSAQMKTPDGSFWGSAAGCQGIRRRVLGPPQHAFAAFVPRRAPAL
jgi:hypothetical protein